MKNIPVVIGQSEYVGFPELGLERVPARIDSGARTCAVWASDIVEKDGRLSFKLFDKPSPYYTGETITVEHFEMREVTPSNGVTEERYMIKLLVVLGGKRIRARFTLANRSTQKYPVLVGRNVLRGKFVVDIKHNFVKAS